MNRKYIFKSVLILFLLGLFLSQLYPTYEFYSLSQSERDAMKIEDPDRHASLTKRAIKLGLDLRGGMYVVLEANLRELMEKTARNKDERLNTALEFAEQAVINGDDNFVSALDQKLQEQGADVALYYGTRDLRSRQDVLANLREQQTATITRLLEILRNRIDQFGVAEPSIQRQGENRVIVELAGVRDRDRALSIIGKTAKLEFKILKEAEVAMRTATSINEYLLGTAVDDDTSATNVNDVLGENDVAPQDTTDIAGELLGGGTDDPGDTTETDLTDTQTISEDAPLFLVGGGYITIDENQVARFKAKMEDPEIKRIIEREAGQAEFLLAKAKPRFRSEENGRQYLETHLVNSRAELEGGTIVDAKPQPGSPDDVSTAGGWVTSITFNGEGADAFSRITGANSGKRMAISLDDVVHSAPNIKERIRGGRAQIVGIDTRDEANDLAIVLRAGALPTPTRVVEERSVGATLGQDSVRQGTWSTILGLILVAIFMLIYYKFSGLIADIALFFNIIILMGIMAALHATLTLPGIAGVILTIGMAVDANVLIFERIREELDRGKSVRNAIDTGYERAFVTILDANVTTFIAAVVLFNFGTGPVKGFATTLMIGIGASMFTAIYVSRTIFEVVLSKMKNIKSLSI